MKRQAGTGRVTTNKLQGGVTFIEYVAMCLDGSN
jgi:hypothetical protein